MECLNISRSVFCFFSLFCWFVSPHYPKYFQQLSNSSESVILFSRAFQLAVTSAKSESVFSYLNFLHWMCIIVMMSRLVSFFLFFVFFFQKQLYAPVSPQTLSSASVWKAVLQVKKISNNQVILMAFCFHIHIIMECNTVKQWGLQCWKVFSPEKQEVVDFFFHFILQRIAFIFELHHRSAVTIKPPPWSSWSLSGRKQRTLSSGIW